MSGWAWGRDGLDAVREAALIAVMAFGVAYFFIFGFFLAQAGLVLDEVADLTAPLFTQPFGIEVGGFDTQAQFGPTVDARAFIAMQGVVALSLFWLVRWRLRAGAHTSLARDVLPWLRGAAVVAMAAGMFNATLTSDDRSRERGFVPELSVGMSWVSREAGRWDGLGMNIAPTVVIRGTEEPPLLVMGIHERPGYDKALPSFTLWIDGIDDWVGDEPWAKPLGGSCRDVAGVGGSAYLTRDVPEGQIAVVPENSFTCAMAPAAERDTDDLLPFFPDGLSQDPVVIELPMLQGAFHSVARGEGVRFHAVGIDAFGGRTSEEYDELGLAPISSLPVYNASDEKPFGVLSEYQRGLGGSDAQSLRGFQSRIEVGAAYAFQWDDAYIDAINTGSAVKTSEVLMFYGEDQQDESWVASWSERRRSKDAIQTVTGSVAIALLGGFVAVFVGATGSARRRGGGATSTLVQAGDPPGRTKG